MSIRWNGSAGSRLLLWLIAGFVLPQTAVAQNWVPQRHVELIVPNSPGGSNDITGRTVQRLWQELKLLPVTSAVVNRGGGEHAVGYNYLYQRANDPHYLCIAVPLLLTHHISGKSAFTYTDVTPIALLTTEYHLLVVPSNSPLKTGKDFVEALRKSPESLSIGVSSVLQRIAAGTLLQSAGVNIKPVKMVVFTGSGNDQATAAAGGHVDAAVTSLSRALPHVESGKLRVIAVGAPKRLVGLVASAPTWGELGFKEGAFKTWRGIIAPKGIAPEQTAYWEGVLRKVAESEEFRNVAEKNDWDVTFMGSADTIKHMAADYAEKKSAMTYLGLVK